MNRFKTKAFLNEFPFISEFLPEGVEIFTLDSIKIQRVDENLLIKKPSTNDWDGSMGSSNDYENVSFILYDGTILKNCVSQEGKSGSNYAHSSTTDYDGETILEAIDREVDKPDEIRYVIIFSHDYSNWEGSDYRNKNRITIYKVPKDKKFSDFIKEAQQKAVAEVNTESNF